jgi:hypothetical protein
MAFGDAGARSANGTRGGGDRITMSKDPSKYGDFTLGEP